jgi:hypothetical protein
VNTDFIRVDIKNGGTADDVIETHMQTAYKKEVLKRKIMPAGIPVDIVMIMFDSTSAANFIRKMPKTFNYLSETLDTVFLKGWYHHATGVRVFNVVWIIYNLDLLKLILI